LSYLKALGRRLCWAALLWWCSAAIAAAPVLEFLYIDANEGNASGGHAALRFDDQVYHFQYVEPGLLRLFQVDYHAFAFEYTVRENRSLYRQPMAITPQQYQSLKQYFLRRLMIQDSQFHEYRVLQDELQLLDDLLALKQSAAVPSMPLNALGYFAATTRQVQEPFMPSTAAPAMLALKQMVERRYGADFWDRQRQEWLQQWQALRPGAIPQADSRIDERRLQGGGVYFAERYRQLLYKRAALEILAAAAPLQTTQLLSRDDAEELRLDAVARTALQAYSRQLAAQLTQIWDTRPLDWGQALLVGMARLQALDRSVQHGRLSVLNTEISDAVQTVRLPSRTTQTAVKTARLNLTQLLADSADGFSESRYAEWEAAANQLLSWYRYRDAEEPVKLWQHSGLPQRPARVFLPDVGADVEALLVYRQQLLQRQAQVRQGLAALYQYQLLQWNCVTELFRQIALAQAESGMTIMSGFDGDRIGDRVPFLAFQHMAEFQQPLTSLQQPSYRDAYITARSRQDTGWAVALQESNVLSSELYRWHDGDAAFVFFTQDAVWPRPLQGGVNLVAAAAQTLFGALRWPWDDGWYLHKGLVGMAVSLPELVFFNIRKASFPELLPGMLDLPDEQIIE
jgi:hypothetical protein